MSLYIVLLKWALEYECPFLLMKLFIASHNSINIPLIQCVEKHQLSYTGSMLICSGCNHFVVNAEIAHVPKIGISINYQININCSFKSLASGLVITICEWHFSLLLPHS